MRLKFEQEVSEEETTLAKWEDNILTDFMEIRFEDAVWRFLYEYRFLWGFHVIMIMLSTVLDCDAV